MAVKIRVNNREFTLSWEEFEKAFYNAAGCVEELDIELKKAGNC